MLGENCHHEGDEKHESLCEGIPHIESRPEEGAGGGEGGFDLAEQAFECRNQVENGVLLIGEVGQHRSPGGDGSLDTDDGHLRGAVGVVNGDIKVFDLTADCVAGGPAVGLPLGRLVDVLLLFGDLLTARAPNSMPNSVGLFNDHFHRGRCH